MADCKPTFPFCTRISPFASGIQITVTGILLHRIVPHFLGDGRPVPSKPFPAGSFYHNRKDRWILFHLSLYCHFLRLLLFYLYCTFPLGRESRFAIQDKKYTLQLITRLYIITRLRYLPLYLAHIPYELME